MRASTRYMVNAGSNWGQLVVSGVVGVIVLRYTVDRLGKEQFGLFPIIGSVLAILMLLDLGISAAVARFSARYQGAGDLGGLRSTTTTALIVMGALGVTGGLALVATIPLVNSFYAVPAELYTDLVGMTVCQAVAFALRFASVPAAAVLIGAGRYELMNGFESLGNLVRLGLLVLLFTVWTPTLLLFGVTFVAHQVVRLVGFNLVGRYAVVRSPLYCRRAVSWSILADLGRFSAIQSVGVLAWTALLQGPNLIIGRLLGNTMVTYYQPSLLVACQLAGLASGLTSPLLPLAAKDAETNGGRRLGEWSLRFGRLVTLFAVALMLPILLLARPILTVWMTEDFAWTAPVFVVAVAAQLFNLTQSANYYLLLGGGRITFWQVSEMVGTVVALSAAVVGQLLLGWGLLGIVGSVGGVTLVRAGAYLPWMCAREFKLPLGTYYRQVYGWPAVPAVLAGVASWGLLQLWPPSGLAGVVGQGLLAVGLFGLLAWWLALTPADRAVVLDLLRQVRQRVARKSVAPGVSPSDARETVGGAPR